ncbi:methyl-accepting chemotaxis protein [Pseudorhodoferax aquiterrae]|uniref:Methyl-accepting chemotaxis protein n=1 Tax=Pseudorhodoferax aquiterrae TaxID=747304 RepID=A0ABQ3G9Y3_9BURK|nr:methyl-accepting chemotaxis protein [Pseudorhodoferax aquiterrae]GHC97983.1 methyl-accepting chemotaxis protein [Pseudorhodoferax aquiterrae]
MNDAAPPSSARPVLARRLVAAFCLTLLLCLAGTAIGIQSLQRVDAATQAAVVHSVANERLVADAYRLQAMNAARYKAFALSSEPEVGELLMADIKATRAEYAGLVRQLQSRLAGHADAERLALVLRHGDAFDAAVKELVAARDSGLTERIRTVFAQTFEPAMQAQMASLAGLATLQREAIDATGRDIAALSASARRALLAFGTAALLLGALLAAWLVRSISEPILQAGQTAQRVASLDLREDIAGHGRDEAGRMLQSLAAMQGALRALVGQVRDAAQAVRTGAGEIALGNQDLSERTGMAASSLQQTAASLEHITGRLQQAAAHSQEAQVRARQAAAQAVAGGAAFGRVVQTMAGIEQSSRKVSDVIGVIDGIAFQTNILALNAAVEAARAGESGRGFAVVAAEVRQLANRSAAAAREIKSLIAESMDSVAAGAQLVGRTSEGMAGIVAAIEGVADTLGAIAQDSRAQTEDIAQINTAVSALDQMTQQNAALVEQAAAASEGLRRQAQALAALISRFTLPADPAPAALAYTSSHSLRT